MISSHSLLVLSMVPSLTSAGILRNQNLHRRDTDVCGTTGFANAAHSYFSSSDAALTTYAGCALRCADDTKCKSFGYNGTMCLLYESSLSTSLAQYAQSDIVYFDAGCVGGLGAAATLTASGGGSSSNSDKPVSFPTASHPWTATITQSLSRSRVTVTRTRTKSRVGPLPTGSGEMPWSSLPWSAKPTTFVPPTANTLPNIDFGNHAGIWGREIEEAALTSTPTDPASRPAPPSASTMLTVVITPSSHKNAVPPTAGAPAAHSGPSTTFGGLGANVPFPTPTGLGTWTTVPWPRPTGAVPLPQQAGQRNGTSSACPDGFQAWPSTTPAASTPKRWFWSFAGMGFPRPSAAPSGAAVGPAAFGGCVPKDS